MQLEGPRGGLLLGMVKMLGCGMSSAGVRSQCRGGGQPCGTCAQPLSPPSSRPCPSSVYNSTSSVRLALAPPAAEKEQPPLPGERSIYK